MEKHISTLHEKEMYNSFDSWQMLLQKTLTPNFDKKKYDYFKIILDNFKLFKLMLKKDNRKLVCCWPTLLEFSIFATLGLHLGFSAMLKIWQVPTCKMEPRSGYIFCKNTYVAAGLKYVAADQKYVAENSWSRSLLKGLTIVWHNFKIILMIFNHKHITSIIFSLPRKQWKSPLMLCSYG